MDSRRWIRSVTPHAFPQHGLANMRLHQTSARAFSPNCTQNCAIDRHDPGTATLVTRPGFAFPYDERNTTPELWRGARVLPGKSRTVGRVEAADQRIHRNTRSDDDIATTFGE